MKILLDENLPRSIKKMIDSIHQVKTVREMNWCGRKNGELLGLLVLNGFDVFLTVDKNLAFQQNLNKFPVSFILIDAKGNKLEVLQPFIPKLNKLLKSVLKFGLHIITEKD